MPILGASAQRLPPPVDIDTLWPGITSMSWTAWNGTTWDLRGSDGVVLMRDGVRGLAFPPVEHYRTESPAVAGSRWRGWRASNREVFWAVLVFSDASSDDWVRRDSKWWASMHPEHPGVWEITTSAGTRRLRCRFLSDGDHSYEYDPTRLGEAYYGVRLIADQPYWEADQIVSPEWGQTTEREFFPGPPFWVGAGQSLSTATISNPGDVPAYPVWTLTGPITTATVGVGTRTVSVPFTIPDGMTLTIDSRPESRSAVDSTGADRTSQLGSSSFAAIPPGEKVSLSLARSGTGTVQARLTPLYFRAW